MPGPNDALYWRELDGVLRQTLGVGVLLASALAAALTVVGAAVPSRTSPHAQASCMRCMSPYPLAHTERPTPPHPGKAR